MKTEGRPETDPEFVETRNLLQAVQQQTEYAKQVQAKKLAEQQKRGNAQQQGQQNGVNGTAVPTTSGPDGQQQSTGTAPTNGTTSSSETAQAQGEGDNATPTQSKPVSSTPIFTKDQFNLLRAQIQAFKFLTKNAPLPANMQQMLFASRQAKRVSNAGEAVTADGEAAAESLQKSGD